MTAAKTERGVPLDMLEARRAAKRIAAREWRLAHPEESKAIARRHHAKMRDRHLAARYGMPVEEYRRLLAASDGLCAICRRPERKVSRYGTPHVLSLDHDHTTGRPRGFLCDACNVGLGMFDHDPLRLMAAIAYLSIGMEVAA